MGAYEEVDIAETLVDELILELADHVITSDYNELVSTLLEIKELLDREVVDFEEFKQLLITAISPYPEYFARIEDILKANSQDAFRKTNKGLLKIFEDGIVPQRVYHIDRSRIPPNIRRFMGIAKIFSRKSISESIRKAYEYNRIIERTTVVDASTMTRFYIASAILNARLGFFYRSFDYIAKAINISVINDNALEVITFAREILMLYSKAPRIYEDCSYFISKLLEVVNSIKSLLLFKNIDEEAIGFLKEKLEDAEKAFRERGIKCIESDTLEGVLESLKRLSRMLIKV